MAKILDWEFTQDGYLNKAKRIDVKEDEETLNIIAERLHIALSQHKELPYVTANQVGYDYSAYALRIGDRIEVYANPIMAVDGGMALSKEHEFGLDSDYYVLRWVKLSVIAYSYEKKLVCERQYDDEAACILQHVLNNLDGISIRDIGLEITPEFEAATPEDQREVLNAYIEELLNLLGKLEEDIAQDSEASKQYEAYKFVKAKAAKEIESERPVLKNRKMRRFLDRIFKKKK